MIRALLAGLVLVAGGCDKRSDPAPAPAQASGSPADLPELLRLDWQMPMASTPVSETPGAFVWSSHERDALIGSTIGAATRAAASRGFRRVRAGVVRR